MGVKVLKWQIVHGSLVRHLMLKTLLFVLALGIFPLLFRTIEPITTGEFDDCHMGGLVSNPHFFQSGVLKSMYALAFPILSSYRSMPCEDNANVTMDVFREIMGKGFLDDNAKALCVGDGSAWAMLALQELGFTKALGVDRHSFFSPLRKSYVYELEYKDNSFDFVFSRALDRVSVPALLVLEIERILRPGGTGAMLVGARDLYSGGLIRSATPVSSFLKSSDVVHVCGISSFTLVLFKKRFDNVASFEHYRLPDECPSITNNKPFLKHLEPLVEENPGHQVTEVSYLPKFMNISSRNRLIYINIGAGEYVNSSLTNWLKPFYPIPPQDFNGYVVDHDVTSLSSYVKKPGITFVYHPNLSGNKSIASSSIDEDDQDGPLPDGEFDFIHWFKETVADGDFVVLAMNAREVELKLLFELFESGAICQVDEIFLRCSNGVDCNSAGCGDCNNLFKGLRNSGVFIHQWWGG